MIYSPLIFLVRLCVKHGIRPRPLSAFLPTLLATWPWCSAGGDCLLLPMPCVRAYTRPGKCRRLPTRPSSTSSTTPANHQPAGGMRPSCDIVDHLQDLQPSSQHHRQTPSLYSTLMSWLSTRPPDVVTDHRFIFNCLHKCAGGPPMAGWRLKGSAYTTECLTPRRQGLGCCRMPLLLCISGFSYIHSRQTLFLLVNKRS